MAEPVAWSPDGTPHSPRFGDIDRSSGAALAQARHVFLGGCGLPAAWAGARQWRILETGFGLGLNFLAAWRAWKDDPARPGLLHFCSVEAHPVAAEDLVRSAQADPELQPLAHQLAQQWWGLVPGVHRLAFEDGRVLLTLAIGDAREALLQQSFAADAVLLDGFDPARNPVMRELATLKAVARLCRRGTRLATWSVAGEVRRELQQCGFLLEERPGLAPRRDCLAGTFDPAWEVRGATPAAPVQPASALVVGAGLAGAAAAASLARRGWQVQVLDAADAPASGASALPAGLLAPHASPDDNLLSRLSRAGVRMTLRECELRLHAGSDWSPSGALERRPDSRIAADLGEAGGPWQLARDDGLWHRAAAWIRPGALVRAWLAMPGVQWVGNARVTALEPGEPGWRVAAADGRHWDAPLVVVATALATATLLPVPIRLHAVRGQVSWDLHAASGFDAGTTPVNGNGHFLPAVPLDEGMAWLSGSTYVRGDLSTEPRPAEHLANLERLRTLVPEVASHLAPRFESGDVRAWCGVRCASTDRRPLVGQVLPGLCVSTAMGSRGLTFAHVAAELLAASLHGEPSPLPARLAQSLDVRRQLADALAPRPDPAGP